MEPRPCAAAVELQRTLLTGRVRTRKDPVLPSPKPAEYLGRDSLGAGEAQIRLHPGQRVGRQARALLDRQADFVLTVEPVRREGYETVFERGVGVERLGGQLVECRGPGFIVEAGRQPRAAIDHFQTAEIEPTQRNLRSL